METIVIDTREKDRAIKKIVKHFDDNGINHISNKMYCGDYQLLSNGHLVIDRKQNLLEVVSNLVHDHERFRNELIRAQQADIKIIFLVEHGNDITSKEDIIWWNNPRSTKRVLDSTTKRYKTVETKATTGETLYKMINTVERKYGCEFRFCTKEQTGAEIIRILHEQR